MTEFEILMQKLNGDPVAGGTNENGEYVIVTHVPETKEVMEHVNVQTAQNNNWLRINNYYRNGDSDESFTR